MNVRAMLMSCSWFCLIACAGFAQATTATVTKHAVPGKKSVARVESPAFDTANVGAGAATDTAQAAPAAGGTPKNAASARDPNPATEKKVTALFWTYGAEQTPVSGSTPFYIGLNLHVETENYQEGEQVDITIEDDKGRDVFEGVKKFVFQATLGADGKATLINVFEGKTLMLYGDDTE